MRVRQLTHEISPISLSFLCLRPIPRTGGARSGNGDVDGSDPPISVPESGAGVGRNLHWRRTPWEGRSRLTDPWREGQK